MQRDSVDDSGGQRPSIAEELNIGITGLYLEEMVSSFDLPNHSIVRRLRDCNENNGSTAKNVSIVARDAQGMGALDKTVVGIPVGHSGHRPAVPIPTVFPIVGQSGSAPGNQLSETARIDEIDLTHCSQTSSVQILDIEDNNGQDVIVAKEQSRLRGKRDAKSVEIEYFTPRTGKRSRFDPMVKLQGIFDKLIVQVRKLPAVRDSVDYLLEPVNPKEVLDYHQTIKNPIDLMTIRQRIGQGRYATRQEFLNELSLMYDNSVEYNGTGHHITKAAQLILEQCQSSLALREQELNRLEQMIAERNTSAD